MAAGAFFLCAMSPSDGWKNQALRHAWQELHLDHTGRVLSCLQAGSVGGLVALLSSLHAGATLLSPSPASPELLQKLCVTRASVLACEPSDLEILAASWSQENGHARPQQLSAVCVQDSPRSKPDDS